jgi:hypothetical protein
VEPIRLQKERKAKEQLEEKHVSRSREKELRPIARDRRKRKELTDKPNSNQMSLTCV